MIKPKIAIATILIVAAALLYAQSRATSSSSTSISKQEMESFLKLIPPQEVERIRTEPEGRKKFVDNLKELLVLGLEAERIGLDDKPDVQADITLMEKVMLANIYRDKASKENPQAIEFTSEQINKYLQEHPEAYDNFLKNNPRFRAVASGRGDDLKQEFARLQMMLEGARRLGLENDPGYRTMVKVQKAAFLASRMKQELFNGVSVSDEEINAFYENNKNSYDETRASHILVMFPEQNPAPAPQSETKPEKKRPKTKEEALKKAQDLLARVNAGEDFSLLAKENSDHTGSAQQGGDLGYFRQDVQFVPEFKDAVFKLKVGEVSDIVETQSGYHIIKVTDKRIAPLDESLKAEIKEQISEKKVREKVEALKAKNSVIIDETFELPAAVPQQTLPQQPSQPEQEGHNH